MFRSISFVFLVLFSLSVAAQSQTGAKIEKFCGNKWKSDYSMVDHCITEQIKSALKVLDYYGKLDRDGNRALIVRQCMGKWADMELLFDWKMIDHCVSKQIQAYNRVK